MEKNRSKENTCEEDQMAAYQKDFKTTVLKIIKELKNDIDKFKKRMQEQNVNIQIQKKSLELKIAITEMKNSLEGLKSGFEQAAQITVNLKKKKPKT